MVSGPTLKPLLPTVIVLFTEIVVTFSTIGVAVTLEIDKTLPAPSL